MSLPTDVLDVILSFLQEDHTTLKACLESHPILSQLAERYSYAHITVDENATIESEIQFDVKLAVVLSRKPHIAKYVRSLEIKIGSYSFSQDLPTILSSDSLPCLTTIALSSSGCVPGSIGWQSLPESFRVAFIASFNNLPSISSVSIVWISGFPLSALNGCNKVKDLTLDGWSCRDGVNITPEDVNGPLRLEALSIKHCDRQSLERLITWAPTRHLRVLELSRLDPCDCAKIPELLSKCSNSLTSLNVDLGTHCASHSLPRDLH